METPSGAPRLYEGAEMTGTQYGDGVIVGQYSTVRNSKLGDGVAIQRFNAVDSSVIGDYSYTGRYSSVLHSVLGAYCSVSWGVSIGGANHDYRKATTHNFPYEPWRGFVDGARDLERFEAETCHVGNDVWIGAGAIINRDARIGDGVVIGAGAVVTRDVEPYSIVAGVPARRIGWRFDEELIERFTKVRWWEFPVEVIKENVETFKMDAEKAIELLEEIRRSIVAASA